MSKHEKGNGWIPDPTKIKSKASIDLSGSSFPKPQYPEFQALQLPSLNHVLSDFVKDEHTEAATEGHTTIYPN